MTEWAKVYVDILGDPKLMRAAREGAEHLDLLPWLIVFAKQSHDDGRLTVGGKPAEPADIAPLIPHATGQHVAAALASCLDLEILIRDADGALRLARWKDRQTKPSDSKEQWRERKQRQRKREKAARNTPVTPLSRDSVTRDNRDCHAPVTRTCHATEQKNYPTGSSSRHERDSGAPALADAARSLDTEGLAEPTPEERALAKARAEQFRTLGSA